VPRCRHRSPRQPTLGADLGVAGGSTYDIYAAFDWLVGQQDDIERRTAVRCTSLHRFPDAVIF
jgi:hypothetical protein